MLYAHVAALRVGVAVLVCTLQVVVDSSVRKQVRG